MVEAAPRAELLRSLGRLARGLSALFWGLPIALLAAIRTATNEWLQPAGMIPPLAALGLLAYGLWQIGHFQRRERVWMRALDRTKLLSVVNLGLAPFIYWWNKMPHALFFTLALALLMISGLLFLYNLNHALDRLAALLPDETLRLETRWFTSVNFGLITVIGAGVTAYLILQQITALPLLLINLLQVIHPMKSVLLLFLVLLPLALTMTLVWKIKEVILHSVFSPQE